jgi:hypothetical protein
VVIPQDNLTIWVFENNPVYILLVSLNHFASSAGRGSASDCAKRLIAMRIAALVLVLPFFALRYLFTLTKSVLSSRVKLIPIRIVISLTMTE